MKGCLDFSWTGKYKREDRGPERRRLKRETFWGPRGAAG